MPGDYQGPWPEDPIDQYESATGGAWELLRRAEDSSAEAGMECLAGAQVHATLAVAHAIAGLAEALAEAR